MRFTDTGIYAENKLIKAADGLFIKSMSQDMAKKELKGLDELMNTDPSKALDLIFDVMVVDEDGNQFEDLVGKKASSIVPTNVLQAVMVALPKAINPDPKG